MLNPKIDSSVVGDDGFLMGHSHSSIILLEDFLVLSEQPHGGDMEY
jgi:hypothetical protein